MYYQEFPPPVILAGLVKCFWVLENEETPKAAAYDKVLPDGCMELIFHYKDPFRQRKGKSDIIQPLAFLYGQIKQHIDIGPTGKTGIVAVRFQPGGAAPFLPVSPKLLTDKLVTVTELFGNKGQMLQEAIFGATQSKKRVQMLEIFLQKRLACSSGPDNIVHEAVTGIVQSSGQINIEELAQNLHISSRQLERRFTATVGLSPKFFARINRFQSVFKLLAAGKITSLTELAYTCGYYDQAHFIRDFRQFSGINPKKYFGEEQKLSDLFTKT